MNKFKIVLFLIAIIFGSSYFIFAQQQQALMEKMLDSYQSIGKTLSLGSTDTISQETKKIISNVIKLKSNVPEEKAEQFNTLMNRIENHSNALLDETTIELLREKYILLSQDMIGYLNTFGSHNGKYYIYACEGDLTPWIQQEEEQRDPYCDSPCGKIIKEIGGK